MGQKFLNHIDLASLSQAGYSPGLKTRINIISDNEIPIREIWQNSATFESMTVYGDLARDLIAEALWGNFSCSGLKLAG